MKLNVVKNAKRNLMFGMINKTIILLMPFIERTIIRYYLGSLYLGLNSLFSSILSVLSIAEMGFGAAIVYNMYKPVAENDVKRVNVFLNFYRNTYRIIGVVVLVIGSLLIPFLPHLIKGTYPSDINLTVAYLIFLSNSVASYFLSAYLTSLLVAYQREDVQSAVSTGITIAMYSAKIVLLILFRNYYLAIIMIPVFTVLQNIIIAYRVKKMYPQHRCEGKLDREELAPIKKLVAGTFVTRACAVTRNSLDSICSSAFLGLTLTAVYNNYYTISHSITIVLGIIATSFLGGVGNHVVTKTVDENYKELELLDYMYMLISGWCTICLLCLLQPFMRLWMGDDMLLPLSSVILMCIYFYALKVGDMRAMYSTTNGLWWHHRYRAIAETIMNLLLNVLLGKLFGVNGIIIATVISLFFCNTLWATSITFGLYFKDKKYLKGYYVYHLKYLAINLILCIITFAACELIRIDNNVATLVVRMVICVVLPAVMYWIIYRNNPFFKVFVNKFLKRRSRSEKTAEEKNDLNS